MSENVASDREQIHDLMVRYGRANEARDVKLMETCFLPDVVAKYGRYSPPLEGIDAFRTYWVHSVEAMATMHYFTNFTYDLQGDEGSYSCYLLAQHWPRDGDPFYFGTGEGPFYTVGARYDARVRRTDDGWRISHFNLEAIWGQGNEKTLGHLGEDIPLAT